MNGVGVILDKPIDFSTVGDWQRPVSVGRRSGVVRAEIQGLRALAVGGVLLFHVGWSGAPGGFLGVDIFFVISGFLITRNILSDLGEGTFSFRQFYIRRLRRLGPALLATLLGSMVAAWWLLSPDETLGLARSAIAAGLGVSNIWFWSQVGYFDPAALSKPLLHTWSLGVEEQYYLCSPAVLYLAFRFLRTNRLLALTAAFAAASLLAASILVGKIPSAVFYWMPFRVFEFAVGGALAVPPISGRTVSRASHLPFLAGLGLIIASMAFLTEKMPMPGMLALLPCIGTALVIAAGSPSIICRVLVNPLAGMLGRISYSLYLVHWPVIVFYIYAINRSPTGLDRVYMLAISLGLGALLYAWVEAPHRGTRPRASGRATGARLSHIVSATMVVGVIAASSIATQGWRFRISEGLPDIPNTLSMWDERTISHRMGRCFLHGSGDDLFDRFDKQFCLDAAIDGETILVVGDSFSSDLFSALSQAFPEADFISATAGNCTPRMDSDGAPACRELLHYVFFDYLPRHKLRAVVLAGNWGGLDVDAAVATARHVQKYAPVLVASSPVRFNYTVPELIFRSRPRTIVDAEAAVYAQRAYPDFHSEMAEQIAEVGGIPFLDIQQLMLSRGPRLFTEKRELIFLDNAHLTRAGARYLSRRIAEAYPKTSDLFPPIP